MFNFDKIFNAKKYQVYKVNLSLEIMKTGILFSSFENLEKFINEQNINVIFFSEYYDEAKNYTITEEDLRKAYLNSEVIRIIENDIEQHNYRISKINFDKPCAVIVSCIYQGQYCYVYMEDDKNFNKEILINSETKLDEILENNIDIIEEKQIENSKIIEELKKELRERIINDNEFVLCRNKELRKIYIKKLLKFKLDEHYKPLKDLWTNNNITGIYRDAINFVELIWNEIKNNKEKIKNGIS